MPRTSYSAKAIAPLEICSAQLPADDVLEAYRSTAPWVTAPLSGRASDFSFKTKVLQIGDVQVRDTTATGAMMNGHLKKPSQADELFVVSLTTSGFGNRHCIGNSLFDILPGDILFLPLSQHAAGWRHQFTSRTVVVPADMVSKGQKGRLDHGVLRNGMPQSLVLTSVFGNLAAQIETLDCEDAETFSNTIGALLGAVLFGADLTERSSKVLQASQKEAAKRYIDMHLAEASLSAGQVAGAVSVSRATLYRQFEEEGGVASFIRARRLERAFALLASEPVSRGRVGQVSEQVGFADSFHFSRAFKRTFGFNPSDVLAVAPSV